MGASLSVTRLNIHHSAGRAPTHTNSYQAALYGEWGNCAWYTRGMTSYAYSRYNTNRYFSFVSLPLFARDRFDGWQASAYGDEIGYDYVCKNWHLTPAVPLYYTYMKLGSYTQSGLDTAN